MRAEDLVFWLDAIRPSEEISGGVLCRRHADSMIVPRNWTLDDLRDPDLHLFRPPAIARPPSTRSRRARHRDTSVEQLKLGGVVEADDEDDPVTCSDARSEGAEPAEEVAPAARVQAPDEDPEAATPWSPDFDAGDDLDGLLAARSPLLARAFRGDDRHR